MNSMMPSQPMKRKSENESSMPTLKRANTAPSDMPPSPIHEEIQDEYMEESIVREIPSRPTTPPLGMTLSHYNPATGSYTSSQINSNHEVKSAICTGMTPVYRPPFERWGSCLI